LTGSAPASNDAADVQDPPRQYWLDLVRGLSAIVVCAGHLRGVFFVDYAQLVAPTPLQSAAYLVTGVGRHAVMVFFVLSGYFVGGSVLRQRGEFRWPGYLNQRLSRLWTVLLPALCLTALVDACTSLVRPQVLSGAFAQAWASGPSIHYSSSPLTFVGNVLFLQTVLVPQFGSNGPLWSLANEFWYYLLFPLCLEGLGLLTGRSLLRRAVALALSAALLVWLPRVLVDNFAVWLLGVVLAMLPKRLLPPSSPVVVGLGLLAFLAAVLVTKSPGVLARLPLSFDAVVGLGAALLVLTLLRSAGPRRSAVRWAAQWSSEISYSLYLVHFPFAVFLGGVLLGGHQAQPGPGWVAVYLAALVSFVGLGACFWWLFERHTPRVRRFTRDRLGLARA
jgi:peptidoglycan/LPS O-acetylase OafA/YrhL